MEISKCINRIILFCIIVFSMLSQHLVVGQSASVELPVQGRAWLEKRWVLLSDSIGGCLGGGQYCIEGMFGWENNVMTTQPWRFFLTLCDADTTGFLIEQLSDTTQSEVHTCPYYVATKGELAVYCLQRVHKINWYDLDESYTKYVDGTLKHLTDFYSVQEVLQGILVDEKERLKMIALWQKQQK